MLSLASWPKNYRKIAKHLSLSDVMNNTRPKEEFLQYTIVPSKVSGDIKKGVFSIAIRKKRFIDKTQSAKPEYSKKCFRYHFLKILSVITN